MSHDRPAPFKISRIGFGFFLSNEAQKECNCEYVLNILVFQECTWFWDLKLGTHFKSKIMKRTYRFHNFFLNEPDIWIILKISHYNFLYNPMAFRLEIWLSHYTTALFLLVTIHVFDYCWKGDEALNTWCSSFSWTY